MLTFRDFPAHVQLLLLSARSRLRPEEAKQIHTLAAQALDWPGFLAVAQHHRVSPLVFQTLDQVRPAGVPEFVREELQRRARINAFEALHSVGEVKRMAEKFTEAGLEFAVLKGVPLSQYLFDNPNTRHVGDIDLLTEPKRLAEQIALLAALGYERTNPKSRLTPLRIASYVNFWKDFTFCNRDSGFELDLHWRLFNNRFHAANRIVAESKFTTVSAFGVPMRVFSPVDQFLYIAAHGVLDAWTYLKSLADVAGFLAPVYAGTVGRGAGARRGTWPVGADQRRRPPGERLDGTQIASPRLLRADETIARRVRDRTTMMLLRQNFQPDRSYASPAQWLRLEIELVPGVRSLAEIASRFVWRPRVWSVVDLPDRMFWFYPILGLLLLPRNHSVQD